MAHFKSLVLAALSVAAPGLLAAVDPTGWWAIRMGRPDHPCEIYFHITRSEGGYKATWSAPMFGDTYLDQALPDPQLDGSKLLVGPFVAEYDEQSDTFAGSFSMFGPSAPAVWHRVAGPAEPELELTEPDAAEPAWTLRTGGEVWSSPVLAGGTLYVGSDDGVLYAVSPRDGAVRWTYATGGAIRCRPALTEAAVLVSSDDGWLHAVARADGTRLWAADLHGGAVKRNVEELDYSQSSPVVEGGVVYCGSADGAVYAVDATTGRELWHQATGAVVRSTPTLTRDLVVVGNWAGKVVALDAKTGAERWTFDGKMAITSDVAAGDDVLLIGSRYSYLWALDPANGREKWVFNYWWSWVDSTATLEQDRAYIGSSDGRNVWCLGLGDGRPHWRFRTDGYAWSQPVIDGDRIYVSTIAAYRSLTKQGSVYVLSKADGHLLRKLRAVRADTSAQYQGAFSSPAFNESHLFFGSTDGHIYAYAK